MKTLDCIGGETGKISFEREAKELFSPLRPGKITPVCQCNCKKLKWTTDLPTQEGWYWIKRKEREILQVSSIEMVEVSEWLDDKLLVTFTGNEEALEACEVKDCEWYGPIEPPE